MSNPVSLVLGIFLGMGTVNGIVLAGLLFRVKSFSNGAKLFGIVILGFAFLICQDLIDLYVQDWRSLAFAAFADGVILLILALFYLYATIAKNEKRKISLRDSMHLVPFLVFLAIYSVNPPTHYLVLFKMCIITIYLTGTFYVVFKTNKEQGRARFSKLDEEHGYLKWLLLGLIITGAISLTTYFLFTYGYLRLIDSDTLSSIALTAIFYAYAVHLIKNTKHIPFSVTPGKAEINSSYSLNNISIPNKYSSSPYSTQELRILVQQLESLMTTEKPYLNPEMTISDLSRLSGVKSYYISQSINIVLGKNFYDFINPYRVEEAKKRILENGKKKTLLSIAFESGFNSKSSFNRIFKESTGQTPSEFRKDIKKSLN